MIKRREFVVRAIAILADKDDLKWFLFRKEHQCPSEHPLVLPEIKRLKVKNFRNLGVKGDKLIPYISKDGKSFHFKGAALVEDVEESINESIHLVNDDIEEPAFKKKIRASTPKTCPTAKKAKKAVVTKVVKSSNEKPTSLNSFLKGYDFVKKMKLSAFDPYERNSEEWISMYENEYQKHSSVEDTGFTNILYLLKTEEGKK